MTNPRIYLHKCVTRSILKKNSSGLRSDSSFLTGYLNKAKPPSLPNCFPIAGERIIRFVPFRRLLVQYEMQPISYRVWTRIDGFIYYDDKH